METVKALLSELEPFENGAPPALRDVIGALRLVVNESEAVGDGHPSWQLDEFGAPKDGKNAPDFKEAPQEDAPVSSSPV